MKVYLAAPYAARHQIAAYAEELELIGINVTSTWLEENHEITDGTTGAATALDDQAVGIHARSDLEDIKVSDLLVLFTAASLGMAGGTGTSGGRHVETGYALALGKPVLVVGEPENVFHRMGSPVFVFPDWHAAVLDIARRYANRDRATAV